MDPITYTPIYSNYDIDDNKNNDGQLMTEYSHSRQLPIVAYISPASSSIRILETPTRSTDTPLDEGSPSHPIHSLESFPWGEYRQQYAQPIYSNDDHDISFTSVPGHTLIAPLQSNNDTKNLPHAQSEITHFQVNNNGLDDPETDPTDLPTTIIDFFSHRYDTTSPPSPLPLPTLAKGDLDHFLLHDLSMIMDDSSACQDDICHFLNTSPFNISTIHTHCSSIPSVAIDNTDRDRPYVCDSCHQKFTRPQDCTRHIKSAHIKVKDVFCHQTGCKKGFYRSDCLKRHLRKVHHLSNI